jgi:hypothetical protein
VDRYAKNGSRSIYQSVLAGPGGPGRTFRWSLARVEGRKPDTPTTGWHTVNYQWWCDGNNDCCPDTITYNGNAIKVYLERRPTGDQAENEISYAMGGARIGCALVSAISPQ